MRLLQATAFVCLALLASCSKERAPADQASRIATAEKQCRMLLAAAVTWTFNNTGESELVDADMVRRFLNANPMPLDPWGKPYTYRRGGRIPNYRSFVLLTGLFVHSCGPDGREWTEDDVCAPDLVAIEGPLSAEDYQTIPD